MTYLLPAKDRAKLRAERIQRGREQGERRALYLYTSLKCSGHNSLATPKHSGSPDGCRNDGSTCLCECHDPA